ncbi:Nuf2 family-domain-containing protein [Cladochytrium replicatum]|nr:Nuf2 family-domain-containing protein [Cladochytrium replicatum]
MAFSFPILKPHEIAACMSDLQLPFSEEELAKPTAARIIPTYEAILEFFTGINSSHFTQPNFKVVEHLEHPELHQDALTFMIFYRHLNKLFRDIGIEDFSVRDIIRPEPGRVRRIFSAIINFAKFREQRMDVFQLCAKKSEQTVEVRQAEEKRNHDIADRVNDLKLQRAEQEPQVAKLKEVNTKLIEELKELNSVKKVLSEETDELKKETKGLEEKLTNTQYLIESAKADCERLRGQIVHSPEQLKQAITELNNSVSNEKANLANVEKRIREQQNKLDAMGSVEQDLSQCLKIMEDCETELQKYRAAAQKLTAEKEGIEAKNAELNDIEMTLQQQKKLLKRAQEMVVRQQKHQQLKRGTQEQKMEELKREYAKVCEEKRANQVKVDEHNYQAAVLEEKVAELKREMEQESGLVMNDFVELRSHLESYQRSLMQQLSPGLG